MPVVVAFPTIEPNKAVAMDSSLQGLLAGSQVHVAGKCSEGERILKKVLYGEKLTLLYNLDRKNDTPSTYQQKGHYINITFLTFHSNNPLKYFNKSTVWWACS